MARRGRLLGIARVHVDMARRGRLLEIARVILSIRIEEGSYLE